MWGVTVDWRAQIHFSCPEDTMSDIPAPYYPDTTSEFLSHSPCFPTRHLTLFISISISVRPAPHSDWSLLSDCSNSTCFLSLVQLLSRVQLFETLRTAASQASLSITNSWSLLKLMSIESVMPSNHLILCLLILLLPSIFSSIRVFYNESVLCIRWPEYWIFIFSIQWIFSTDFHLGCMVWSPCSPWVSQKSSPTSQFQSINFLCSAFFMVQLSHPYMTAGKTIALTRQTFVGKVMSLLLNMLSRFVIVFLLRSKRLLISQLKLPSSVILKPKKIKSVF